MTTTQTQLQDIFREVFDDDDIEISDAMTADDLEEWDSMMHINLIFACEQKFDIKFALAEIAGLKDVGELRRVIEEKSA